jgi:hypothetical protein
MDATDPDRAPEGSRKGDDYPALARAVHAAERRHAQLTSPLERAVSYGKLLRALGEHVAAITAERDAALIEVLGQEGHPSHRNLARNLGLSRQRVDQLAAIAARGGRPRRDPDAPTM